MALDATAEYVVRQANAFVEADGGSLVLVSVANGVARVRYRMGKNEQCPECVLAPEDLKTFLLEMFAQNASHISAVELEVERA